MNIKSHTGSFSGKVDALQDGRTSLFDPIFFEYRFDNLFPAGAT